MGSIGKRKTKHGFSYRAEVLLTGYPRKTKTFKRASDAQEWIEDTEHALLNNLPLPGESLPSDDKSITDAVGEYLQITEQIPSRSRNTILTDRGTGKRLINAFGSLSLRTLTREDVEEYKFDRLQQVGPASIRHDMSMLSRIYETARIKWRMKNLEHPGRDVPLPAQPPARKKIVPEIRFKSLLDECKASKNPMLYPLVYLLLNTGMRPSEAALLRRNQVLFDEGLIDLTKTKTEPRRVPLSPSTKKLLKVLCKGKGNNDLILTTEENAAKDKPVRFFRRAFEQACIRAKINSPKKRDGRCEVIEDDAARVTLYSLRHSAATYLLQSGVDLETVRDILGHKNISQTSKYLHVTDAHKKKAVKKKDLPWLKK